MQYEYTLRRSSRAKYMSLRITHDHRLEVVLPQRVPQHEAIKFLQQNKNWIDQHSHLIKSEQEQHRLIDKLNLLCLSQQITIHYHKTLDKRVRMLELFVDTLHFSGPIQDMRSCQKQLNSWLRHKAERVLIPLLEQYSNEMGLNYRSVSVRHQKARWGSCSQDGDISLNVKLLFKPLNVVRYVLIHELCHLIEMNHSKKFWALVRKYVPDYRELKIQLSRTF